MTTSGPDRANAGADPAPPATLNARAATPEARAPRPPRSRGARPLPSENAGDGRDELGRDLTITIRIGPDGVVYFHDLTVDLAPVALALAPGDPDLARRAAAAARYEEDHAR